MWKCSIEDADVLDKSKLACFRQNYTGWLRLLDKDDRNSISSQISDMLWEDAAWRSLNKARSWAHEDEAGGSKAVIVAGLLDRGYISGQIIAISKLLEASNPKHPKRGVASLRRLVEELANLREIFTREVWVCHDGLPYDYRAEMFRQLEAASNSDDEFERQDTDGSGAWAASQTFHELFDRLSGVEVNSRSRNDRIADSIFDALLTSLDSKVFEEVLTLRNKSVAHAADEFSRSTVGSLRHGLKLDEIAEAHRLLLGIHQAISAGILNSSWRGSAVPVPQYDHFKHLDSPIVAVHRLPQLHDFWREHCEERDEWLTSAYRDFIPGRE